MSQPNKATVEEIRRRFDNDVERFSNLETGQSATMDAPLVLELVTRAATSLTPQATSLLDIGCGAGNFSLKLRERLPALSVTLVDLSGPMLERAVERVQASGAPSVRAIQGDIRDVELGEDCFDIVVAAAVLHHLRTGAEWEAVFSKIYRSLRPGGSFWIADLVRHSTPEVQSLMWARYGEYLAALRDEAYRDHVFSYVEYEDTPRPVLYQTDLMRKTGFREVELLHANTIFAAFGGLK